MKLLNEFLIWESKACPKVFSPLSYKGPVPISVEKKKNLLELLPYIDKTFHSFYKSLITKGKVADAIADSDSSDAD